MGVVYVSNLESCPVPGETSGTESRKTTLVGNLGQRVGLVHELGKLARSEERIDNGRQGLGVDQVDRVELLAVADVHPFADGSCHPGKTYSADTPVAEVVNIVDSSLGVDQRDEILDDLDDVVVREDPDLGICAESKLLVEAESSDYAKVVPLLGEEELVYDIPCSGLIRRFRITELFVKVVDSRTCLIEEDSLPIKNLGVWIDIFPLDNLPEEEKQTPTMIHVEGYLQELDDPHGLIAQHTFEDRIKIYLPMCVTSDPKDSTAAYVILFTGLGLGLYSTVSLFFAFRKAEKEKNS